MIDEKRKIELFDEFYEWLKNDGLKAIKSERLHKKKIFSSLLNNHQMTLDNFTDFLTDKRLKQIKNLKFQIIKYNKRNIFIDDIEIVNSKEEFILKNKEFKLNIVCKFSQLKNIEELVSIEHL